MNTSLQVLQAGPLVSVQDKGRHNHMRFGVSASGAMDRSSFVLGNAALGNLDSNPAIEVSLGGIVLKCTEGAVSAAVVGGDFNIRLNEKPLHSWSMFSLNAGDTLAITPGASGSWCYICFTGHLDTHTWLGSQSVHLKSGICGSAIVANDTLQINKCTTVLNGVARLNKPTDSSAQNKKQIIRTVVGPQDRFFETKTVASLYEQTFTISAEYDRMGMRFNGVTLPIKTELNMPSEPISRGSLQVPGHGDPICLMADHQTAGGYPKIATVISADLDALSQCRTGDKVQFTQASVTDAITAARAQHDALMQLRAHFMLNTSLMESRLWGSNLISGAESGLDCE